MRDFSKQAINLATIFTLVLVGFSFVRLLPLNTEWQAVTMAVLVALLFLIATKLMQRPTYSNKRQNIELPPSLLELVTKLQQSLHCASADYYIYVPAKQCYVHTITQQTLSVNHPIVGLLQQQPHWQRQGVNQALIPEMYVEELFQLFDHHQANTVGTIHVKHVPYPLVIFFTPQTVSEAICAAANQQFGQLFYLEIDRQLATHTTVVTASVGKWLQPAQYALMGGLFVLFTLWYVFNDEFVASGFTEFTSSYGITAFISGIFGLYASVQWKYHPRVSLSLRWISIGLLLQLFGQFSYIYYFSNSDIAYIYPSFGDIGFLVSELCYLIAALFIASEFNILFHRNSLKQWFIFIAVLSITLLGENVLFYIYYDQILYFTSGTMESLMNLTFSLIEGLFIASMVVVVMTSYYLDNEQKLSKHVCATMLLAMIWQALCNYIFTLQDYGGYWIPNGWNDYMYFVSYAWFGVLMVISTKNKTF